MSGMLKLEAKRFIVAMVIRVGVLKSWIFHDLGNDILLKVLLGRDTRSKEDNMKLILIIVISIILLGCVGGRIPVDSQGIPSICGYCPYQRVR
jgi:hypothetical protein